MWRVGGRLVARAAGATPKSLLWLRQSRPAAAQVGSDFGMRRWFSDDDKSPLLWFDFSAGEAVSRIDDIGANEDFDPLWKVSQADLQSMWKDYDEDNNGVVPASKVSNLIERVLEKQRKSLSKIIHGKLDEKSTAQADIIAWLPKWKQWGLGLELTQVEDEIKLAEELLLKLHDPKVAEAMKDAMHPGRDGQVSHFSFMSTLSGDAVKLVELDALKEAAQAVQSGSEEDAAPQETDIEVKVKAERDETSDVDDEDLDFMDLLTALDVQDYAGRLYEEQIETVEDLKELTKQDLRGMDFSVGAANRLYKWVKKHRDRD